MRCAILLGIVTDERLVYGNAKESPTCKRFQRPISAQGLSSEAVLDALR